MIQRSFVRVGLVAMLLLWQSVSRADFEEDYARKNWQEIEFQLPAMPQESGLIPFYVSASTSNRFFVDGPSLSVGADGVVRYVLVVLSPTGARSVTFEGMRCETKERRVYASGHSDGSWAKSRRNDWVKIQDAAANRQHAALYLEYFCPGGVIVASPEIARATLVRGGPQSAYQ